MQFFTFAHLPDERMRTVSAAFRAAAELGDTSALEATLRELPRNPESEEATRKVHRSRSFFNWALLPRSQRSEQDLEIGLRFLLEAKDCAVRSLVYREPA
jgi:hypothetical protein